LNSISFIIDYATYAITLLIYAIEPADDAIDAIIITPLLPSLIIYAIITFRAAITPLLLLLFIPEAIAFIDITLILRHIYLLLFATTEPQP